MNDKAFMVFSGTPQEGVILVFAKNRNKAKSMCVGYLFDWEYQHMNTRRMPGYDIYYDKVKSKIVDCNDGLPDGAPDFYSDVEL